MLECSAPLQILLPLVTFCSTNDCSMWRYNITGIAHVALCCKSCITLGGIDSYATSRDKFAPEHYMRYTSDTVVPHAAITGNANVALRYNTILQRTLH
jgi:hypothetical protein